MCSITDNLILCTCDGNIDTTKPHWILKRQASQRYVIGTSKYRYGEVMEESVLIESLNNDPNLFDFDYIPSQDDMLLVYVYDADDKLKEYCFTFNDGFSSPGSWSGKDIYDTSLGYEYLHGTVKKHQD